MLSSEQKARIDSLTTEEMLQEINLGNKSRFQGEKYAYLKSQHQLRLQSERDKVSARSEEREKEANSIARDDNLIAKKALSVAEYALSEARKSNKYMIISIAIAAISTLSAIIMLLHKILK